MIDWLYLYAFLLILFIMLISKLKVNSILTPVLFVSAWWFVWLILSTYGFFDMYIPSGKVYFIFLSGITMFIIGNLTFIRKVDHSGKNIRQFKVDLNIGLLNYLQIFSLFFLIAHISKAYSLFLKIGMNPAVYRGAVFVQSFWGSLENFAFYILYPIILTSLYLNIAYFLLHNKNKRGLLLAIINGVIYCVITLGRYPLLVILISFALGFLYLHGAKLFNIKLKHVLVTLSIILIILSITFVRIILSGDSISIFIFEQFVMYFTGPFIAFERFYNHVNYHNIDFVPEICQSTFAGIGDIITKFLSKLNPDLTNPYYATSSFTYPFFYVSPTLNYSFAYSMMYNFYRDGGYLGVVFYTYTLGAVVALIYNKFLNYANVRSFAFLLQFSYISIAGLLFWQMYVAWDWAVIALIFLLTKKSLILDTGEDSIVNNNNRD